jgi:hypothetical protein
MPVKVLDRLFFIATFILSQGELEMLKIQEVALGVLSLARAIID